MSEVLFKKYIKAVGTGPRGNRDLSIDETESAFDMILGRKVSVSQIAAFLLGWRLKPETTEEFKGALNSILRNTQCSLVNNSLELGIPFDGKNDSPYIYPLVAKMLLKFDVKLIVTGDHKIPAKDGVTTKEIEEHWQNVEKFYKYYDRKKYCEAISDLYEVRNDLGLRTALNTLEKYSGVAESRFCATGVFHKPYVEKYIEIFKDRLDGLLLVAGNEGSPELFKKSKCWFLKSGVVEELIIDPADFGIELDLKERYEISDCLQELENPSGNIVKIAALNAAIYLYLMSKVETIELGFKEILGP